MVKDIKLTILILAIGFLITDMPQMQTLNAQGLSLSLAFTDTTICKGDSIDQIITFSGNPKFNIEWNYPYAIPPLTKNVWKIPNLAEPIVVTITGFSDADTAITDTVITFSLKVTPAAEVAISGGGEFCKSDTNITPLVAHFEGSSPWTFLYMIDDTIQKIITSKSSQYVISSNESISIEAKMIQDKNCVNYNIGGLKNSLLINGEPAPNINGPKEVCEGEIALYDTKPNDKGTYSWIINTGAESKEVINAYYRNIKWIEAGTHRINLSHLTNNAICPISTKYLDVVVHPKPKFENKIDTSITCFEKDPSFEIFPKTEQTSSVYWPHSGAKTHSISLSEPGDYMLIETTTQNCTDTAFYHIRNRCSAELFIADAFTPNGDGINDELEIFGYYFGLNVYFFNLNGEWIYTYYQGQNFWDGNCEGIIVPNGTYLWNAEFFDEYDEKYEQSGKVTVIR